MIAELRTYSSGCGIQLLKKEVYSEELEDTYGKKTEYFWWRLVVHLMHRIWAVGSSHSLGPESFRVHKRVLSLTLAHAGVPQTSLYNHSFPNRQAAFKNTVSILKLSEQYTHFPLSFCRTLHILRIYLTWQLLLLFSRFDFTAGLEERHAISTSL